MEIMNYGVETVPAVLCVRLHHHHAVDYVPLSAARLVSFLLLTDYITWWCHLLFYYYYISGKRLRP